MSAAVRCLGLCLLLAAGLAQAAVHPVRSSAQILQPGVGSVVPDMAMLIDDGRRDLAAVRTAGDWQPVTAMPRLGFTDKTVWLRFKVRRTADGPIRMRLEIAQPLLDELDIHVLAGGEPVHTWLLGDTRPHDHRPFFFRNFMVPLDLPADRTVTVFLRVHSGGSVYLPVRMWELDAFTFHEQRALLAYSFIYGTILSALMVFLFAAAHTRERRFGHYVLFVFSLTFFQATVDGFTGQYLRIDWPWWNRYNTALTAMVVLAITTALTMNWLGLRRHMPRVIPVARALLVYFLLVLPATLLMAGPAVFPLLAVSAAVFGLAGVLFGLYSLYRRVPQAGSYAATMLLFCVGTLSAALERAGLVPSIETAHQLSLGAILLQVLLLGYLFAARIREETTQQRQAQERTLAAQRTLLAAEWQLTYELEREVDRQTAALSATMRDLEQANRALAEMSRHDALTGLYNRRHFDERFDELVQMAARQRLPLAVLMVDIDHFKQLNDTWGHQAGDECLRQVGATLHGIVSRRSDLVARYGGEEFVVVLPDTDLAVAMELGERLRDSIEKLDVNTGEHTLHITASFGLAARVPRLIEDAYGKQLLAAADAALYLAKKNGRNRLECAPDDTPEKPASGKPARKKPAPKKP